MTKEEAQEVVDAHLDWLRNNNSGGSVRVADAFATLFWHQGVESMEAIESARREAIRSMPPLAEIKLSEKDLLDIEGRWWASTRGKWEVLEHNSHGPEWEIIIHREGMMPLTVFHDAGHKGNIEFTASAHQDIPSLLSDLRTALRLLDECWQDGSLQKLAEIKAAAYEAGKEDGETESFEMHWRTDESGAMVRRRITGFRPSDTSRCEWCHQMRRTKVGEVWSEGDRSGSLVRLCEECASRCAGG